MDLIIRLPKKIRLVYPYILIIIFHLPFFLTKNSYIQILDVLNAEFLYNHLLKINNKLFYFNQFAEIKNVIDGWKILYIHSQFKLIKLFFYFFDSYYAYVLHSIFIRSLGFFGIKLLFKELFKKIQHQNIIFLTFALLPGLTIFGGCLWALPLLIWGFLKLEKGFYKKGIISVIVYLITSSPYQLPFIVLIIFFYLVYNLIKEGKLNFGIILGGLIFSLVGIVLEFNLLIGIFSNNLELISHRTFDFNNIKFPTFLGILYQYLKIPLFGEYNPSQFFSLPILFLTFIYFKTTRIKFQSKIIFLYILIFLFTSLKIFTPQIISLDIPILTTFGIEKKILYFIPICFFLILGYILSNLKHYDRLIFFALLSLFISNVLRNPEISYNILGKESHMFLDEDYFFKEKLFGDTSNSKYFNIDEFSNLSYKDYFSRELFSQIKDYLSEPLDNYKILNVGISPSVTLFNGFHNMDAYLSNHSNSYNLKFDKIQDKYSTRFQHKLRIKYDGYEEICNNCTINDPIKSINLNFKKEVAKKMKIDYVFSAFLISNSKEIGLELRDNFSNKVYNIFIYKLL